MSGPLACLDCHKLAAGSGILRCLECHTEIAQRISQRHGLHAAIMNPSPTSRDCVPCHSEHNGENFPLIRWEPSLAAFDHRKTGYPLEGKHAELNCRQCHNAKNTTEAARATIKVRDPNRTFLGLSRDCSSCHGDPHRGQLGTNCRQCHNMNEWKKPSGFDHSKTKFPLTGAHVRVACLKCHKPVNGDIKTVKYVGLAFDKCAACHNDPHHGAFKAGCDTCHNTSQWKELQVAGFGAHFDHSKTKYPLLGKHAQVHCETCHHGQDFSQPLAHDKCTDCHKDAHRGQFIARKDGGPCEACHTVDGFKPSKFGVVEHASTTYPLEGKHAAVQCAKCHLPAGQDTIYKIKATRCVNCHQDIHKGQFAQASSYGNQCESCHTVKGFTPSTFTLARHNKTHFPLMEAHLAVACNDCHQAKKPTGSASPVPYHFADLSCTTCHEDPHRNQFAERMKVVGADKEQLGCRACHSLKTWTDIERFDHSTTAFALLGSHRAVSCISCHRPPNMETTMHNVNFRSAPKQCDGCHEDPHDNQFARNGRSPQCAECHNTNKWRPSLFDHDKSTTFALKGVHRDVRCGACHTTVRAVASRSVLFYKPTPSRCAACHGATQAKVQ